ncbi:MAG: hypothetical protein ACFFCZ_06490 [Promethearchaeota archaeon]
MTLQDRTFTCAFCGQVLGRELHAALNLEQYYYMFIHPKLHPVAESSTETLNACREPIRLPTGSTARRSRKKATNV